eukprot:5087381-Prymnesium_polylepis.1
MPFRVCSSARPRPLHTRLHDQRRGRTQRCEGAQDDCSTDLSHLGLRRVCHAHGSTIYLRLYGAG